MTTGGYFYDPENRLQTAGGVTYTYDGDGRLLQKSSGKLYWYGVGTEALDETDLTGSTSNAAFSEYAFFDGKRVARRDFSNSVFYYFADHLDTSRVMVQAGQTTACYRADFYPFGGERTPIVNTCPLIYKFTGKERDTETQLDNFEARHYSSASARFISADTPLVDQGVLNPQSWNLYSYVRNNPLRYTDPSGHGCVPDEQGGWKTDNSIPGESCEEVAAKTINAAPNSIVEGVLTDEERINELAYLID
jgi:RHS repeat-associated protein